MAFIKCQYTDDYLLTKNQLVISRKRDYIKDNRNEKCYMSGRDEKKSIKNNKMYKDGVTEKR